MLSMVIVGPVEGLAMPHSMPFRSLVDRIQRLVPSSDGGDDFVWISGPCEGLWLFIVLIEEPVDGGLQIDNRRKDTAFQSALCELGEKPSMALSQDAEVGVKWKVQRGWRVSHWRTLGCLWVA